MTSALTVAPDGAFVREAAPEQFARTGRVPARTAASPGCC